MSDSLILVTTCSGLTADGRRVAWQSFRPASAAAGSDPTVYFTTLGAAPDATGTTSTNLITAGVQAINHPVTITLLDGPAELKLADGKVHALPVGGTYTLPARGTADAVVLTFTALTCTLKAEPQRGGVETKSLEGGLMRSAATTEGGSGQGDGGGGGTGTPPPPPLPGNDGND